jgi:NAD(P)H-hydrate epimerase
MKLLTKRQSQELDRIAIKEMGIPGATLMGNAGIEVAKTALQILGKIKNPVVLVICGKGNNGGDGFKAALELNIKGIAVQIITLPEKEKITGDARIYYDQCIEQKIELVHSSDIPFSSDYDLIIDAIFGTGFSGQIRSPISKITNWINQQSIPVLAVDIPSGVDAENGDVADESVKADVTVTMGYKKVGMQLAPGRQQCGEIEVVEIGFPDKYYELPGLKWSLIDPKLPEVLLNPPVVDTYKHRQGKVLIIAGSTGMTGAAILSSMASIRAGAGLVLTCAPSSLNSIYEGNIIEGLTISCDDENLGYLCEHNFVQIDPHLKWCDCVLIGPGLGGAESTVKLIEQVIQSTNKPVVIDADALRPLAAGNIKLSSLDKNAVITPHFGEFEAINGIPQKEINYKLTTFLAEFMQQFAGTLVLKRATTMILNNSRAVVNTSGNQGLATGGTGDVLSGMIASYIAQGLGSYEAAQLGVYIHGLAAELSSKSKGYRGLIASDLLDKIPEVVSAYEFN